MKLFLADPNTRRLVVTFTVAGIAAVVGEHYLKPSMKRRLKLS